MQRLRGRKRQAGLHWQFRRVIRLLAEPGRKPAPISRDARAALERLTDIQFRSWTQRIVLGVGLVYLVQGIAAYAGG